ncbi:MAG: DUF11 domain-containing protein [Scytolyngbya sp. HA4215-MV1]|nr:DUF11 domain-containing protein [Scytolyngbya sp. HA4215-MV1]
MKLGRWHQPSRWVRYSFEVVLFTSTFLLPLSLLNPQAVRAACSAGTITRVSAPILYIDTGITPAPRGMHVGYRITNTSGAAYSDLWVKLESFTGGVVSLGPNEDGIMHVGPLANGASKMVYFFVTATGATATAQTHTVSLYATRPDLAGSSLCGSPFPLTVEETIKAVANKIVTSTAGPNPPELGGIMTMTITGQTGTIGAAGIFAVSPASYLDWPANSYQLVGTQITMSGGNTTSFTDVLYGSGLNSPATDYTIVYTFVATGSTAAPTTVSPISEISSGTQIKHNDTGSGTLAAIQPTANKTTISGKTASPSILPTGGVVTYTVTLNNAGAVDVTLDDITDILPSSPANVTYTAGSAKFNGVTIADPKITGQTLTFLGLFTIPAGTSRTLTYQANVPGTLGSYTNQVVAHIGNTQIDTTTNTGDNAPATATVSVGNADVVVTKTGPATVAAGSNFTYSITATNNGPAAAANVVLKDTLPAGATFVSATNGGTLASGVVTWPTIASLASGASVTYQVTVQAPASGTLLNTASSTSTTADANPANNNGSLPASQVSTTVTPSADLSLTKTHGGSFTVGQNATYTLTVANTGPSTASSPITVTDTLPAGLTFVSGSGTGWICNAVGQTVTCTNPNSLASGANSTILLTVAVGASASPSVTNTAMVSSTTSDPTPANNTATDPTAVTPAADLSITKTDGQTSTTPGSPISYTITVTNNGLSTVNSVTVTDAVPASIQSPVFTPSTGSYNSGTGAWTGLNLAAGQSITLTISGTVSTSASGTITNTATVAPSSGTIDPTPANNSATDITTITASADLSITKTDGKTSITPGSPTAYTITVTNNGSSTVNSVTVTDTVPASIQSPVFTPSIGSYNSSTGAWTGLNLATGQSIVLTVSGTVATSATGTITNTATVTPPTGTADSNNTNNSATDTTTITSIADLRLTKTVDVPVPAVGATITYTVRVTNVGPSDATNVAVQDLLPAGLTFSSATPSQGSYDNTTGLWTVGTIADGSNAALQIAAIVNTSELITNTAEVSASDQIDPNSTPNNQISGENDQASVSIPFAPPHLQLIKRITSINGVSLSTVMDDPTSTADNAANWPLPLDVTSGISSYLRGVIDGGTVQPGDILEYTIYFLSDGGTAATNIQLCDLVPANSTFVPNSFASMPESGIALAIGAVTTNLTNVPDSDGGEYFVPGSTPSANCSAANTNGAVVVKIVSSPTNLPNATAPGVPANSYGFIRFRARVK